MGHNQHKFSALRLWVACWKLLRHGCDPTQGQTSLPPSSVHVTVPIKVATAQPSSAPGWFTVKHVGLLGLSNDCRERPKSLLQRQRPPQARHGVCGVVVACFITLR